jgi:hypothetical protein
VRFFETFVSGVVKLSNFLLFDLLVGWLVRVSIDMMIYL